MPLVVLTLGILIAYALWVTTPNAVAGLQPVKMPPHPWGTFIPGDRVIIIGLPLSGKTYLAARLTASAQRVLFFDPYHDYKEMAKAEEISADDLIADPTKYLHRSSFRYAIIPDEDALADQLEDVVSLARAATNLVLVMDEVGDYKEEADKTLKKLARNGRHNGLVPVYVSQVAMDIPRTVRRLATRVYSFRQADMDDLDALAERYGEDYSNKVANLPPHEYALWTLPGFAVSNQSQPKRSNESTPTQS